MIAGIEEITMIIDGRISKDLVTVQSQYEGLFAYSDAPAPICGSGIGMFHWFQTKTEILEFVPDYMAWYHPSPSSMSAEQIADTGQSVVAGFDASHGDLEQLRGDLNQFMQNMWQIDWWGQFGELIDGCGYFPARIRADFLEDREETGVSTTAIRGPTG